jgi:hypothetical protein
LQGTDGKVAEQQAHAVEAGVQRRTRGRAPTRQIAEGPAAVERIAVRQAGNVAEAVGGEQRPAEAVGQEREDGKVQAGVQPPNQPEARHPAGAGREIGTQPAQGRA